MEQKTTFDHLKVNFIKSNENWIHLPLSLSVWVSNDGKDFTKIKESSKEEIAQNGGKMNLKLPTQNVRFVKIIAQNTTKIPQGFAGAGFPAWLFVDEVSIN